MLFVNVIAMQKRAFTVYTVLKRDFLLRRIFRRQSGFFSIYISKYRWYFTYFSVEKLLLIQFCISIFLFISYLKLN